VVNATTEDRVVDQAAVDALGSEGRTLDEQAHDTSVFARGVFALRDSSGNVVGGLVVRHDITPLSQTMRQGLLQAIAFFVGLALIASIVAFFLVDRIIFRRLRAMTTTMEDASMRLAGGDYSVAATVKAASRDELGQFEQFFGNFLGLVGNTLRSLVERSRQQRATQVSQAAQPAPPPAKRGA
jgi:methyl-accepting chemotaxis protein